MERLQIAVEKARAKRLSKIDDHAREAAGRAGAAPAAPLAKPTTPGKAALWKALRPLETNSKVLRQNRLVAFSGGPEAAPYDLLRTKIIHQCQQHGWRRIAIVSPHSACGKTTTTANLAFSFARQKDLSTIFFDLDLRRPALAKVMGRQVQFNMADILEHRVSFAEHGERYGENVAFGFNNEAVGYSAEILQSVQTQEVLDEIQRDYAPDLMIFDMPPMLASDDNFGFLKNVDCALLVVAAERTPMHQIDVTERQLAELTSVMGVILNKCSFTDGAYGYEYEHY